MTTSWSINFIFIVISNFIFVLLEFCQNREAKGNEKTLGLPARRLDRKGQSRYSDDLCTWLPLISSQVGDQLPSQQLQWHMQKTGRMHGGKTKQDQQTWMSSNTLRRLHQKALISPNSQHSVLHESANEEKISLCFLFHFS